MQTYQTPTIAKKPIVFLFPGQGSQYYQMGRELNNVNPLFRQSLFEMDEFIIQRYGFSILNELYDESRLKGSNFSKLQYTHPAIFMVSIALAKLLMAEGVIPDYLVGMSLGEFSAIVISDAVKEQDMLAMLMQQINFIEQHVQKGKMITIIETIQKFKTIIGDKFAYEIASSYYEGHFVISIKESDKDPLFQFLRQNNIFYVDLPVDYGFHSSALDQMQTKVLEIQENMPFAPLKIPMVSCVDGQLRLQLENDYAWKVCRNQVRFNESIMTLEEKQNCIYIDLSSSAMFSSFLKKILPLSSQSEVYATIDLFNNEIANVQRIIQKLAI